VGLQTEILVGLDRIYIIILGKIIPVNMQAMQEKSFIELRTRILVDLGRIYIIIFDKIILVNI
jgi:hypothetical protein